MTSQVSQDEAQFEQNLLQRGIVRATYIVTNFGRNSDVTNAFLRALLAEGFNETPVRDVEWALNRVATITHNVLVELPNRQGMPSMADIADAIHQRVGLTDILK